MPRSTLLVCTLLALAFPAASQSSPTNKETSYEETYVRNTYARLTYLSRVTVATSTATDILNGQIISADNFEDNLRDQAPTFDLTHFNVGNIAELPNVPWSDLVTPEFQIPETLFMYLGTRSYCIHPSGTRASTAPDCLGAYADWRSPKLDQLSGPALTSLSKPAREFLSVSPDLTIPGNAYTRFAAFTITTSFQGKTLGPYNALFLFGKTAKGQPVVSTLDMGTPGGILSGINIANAYPFELTSTPLRNNKMVIDWLSANTVSSPACTEGKHQICCSESRCGITEADLQKDLSAPLNQDANPAKQPPSSPTAQTPPTQPPPPSASSTPAPAAQTANTPATPCRPAPAQN